MTNEEIGVLTLQYNQTIKELNRNIYRLREELRGLRNERKYWQMKRDLLGQCELFPINPNPTKN
ncbi:MAG: hypothetical protein IKC23_05110 [Fibrobacter sp.]|nr:hypothetical protein [Fibrobacter sp.]